MITSVSNSNFEILQNIKTLYLDGRDFDCDLTYNLGKMYNPSVNYKMNPPKLKYDKYPQRDDIHQLDDFITEVEDNSLESIVCDPPFIIRPTSSGVTPNIENKYSSYESEEEFKQSQDFLLERAITKLKPKGILVYKIQNSKMYNKKQCLAQNYVINKALELGFDVVDEFIKINIRPMPLRGEKQHCSRKVHSYFLVFRKRKEAKEKNI